MPEFVPFERILIVALDSLSWEMLQPLINDQSMPALASLLQKSHYGILKAPVPLTSTATWTSFLTGKDPGSHGIYDSKTFVPAQQSFQDVDVAAHHKESILSRLSEDGISCGSVFLPCTYPAYPLDHGYMISGPETPDIDAQFTEPEELRDELLNISQNLHFNFEPDWIAEKNDDVFSKNIDRALLPIDLLEHLAVHFQRERPVQLQIAYLQATEIVLRKAWRWCDPQLSKEQPGRRDLIKRFFRRIDQMLNRVLGLHTSSKMSQRFRKDGPKTMRVICSGQGQGAKLGEIFINSFLRDWGFLSPLNMFSRISRRMKFLSFDSTPRDSGNKDMGIAWSDTRAYMPHAAANGYVYVNLRGREPNGIVSPENFDNVRDELIEHFMHENIPGTNEPLFRDVIKGEDKFANKTETTPDLIVIPTQGFTIEMSATAPGAVRMTPSAVEGAARSEGIYLFEGPGIRSHEGLSKAANVIDLVPTILTAFGLPVPRSMNGKAMLHLFGDRPPLVRYCNDPGTRPNHDTKLHGRKKRGSKK